jgi:hypothetical protein
MGNQSATQVQNYRYPSGNVYSGSMVGGKRSGQGTLTWPDGGSYTGTWRSDECEGQGLMRFPNGSSYEGAFVRNNPRGDGKFTTTNGEVLMGFWEYLGRADRASTPIGKYSFQGELIDLKTNKRTFYHGPLALYLQSGLVSLPNMPDPMESMLPYAVALTGTDSKDPASEKVLAEEGRALFKGGMDSGASVPVAYAVQTASTTSSSVSYGRHEPAFQERHPDDHAAFNLLDPRLYLAGLGLPTQPVNINQRRQEEIRMQQNGNSLPVAVPVNDQTRGPVTFST